MSASFAALNSLYGVVVLDDDLAWQSEDLELARLASMLVRREDVGPADGDPQAAMLRRLQARIGGDCIVRQDWRTSDVPPDGVVP